MGTGGYSPSRQVHGGNRLASSRGWECPMEETGPADRRSTIQESRNTVSKEALNTHSQASKSRLDSQAHKNADIRNPQVDMDLKLKWGPLPLGPWAL